MNKAGDDASCSYRLATPAGPGAIAIIDLFGCIDSLFEQAPIAPVAVGEVKLRSLAGVDHGVVVRWSEHHAQLMPHAGRHIVRSLIDRLHSAGAIEAQSPNPLDAWLEAANLTEAIMLDELVRAQSPAAVDLLLAQPERWCSWNKHSPTLAEIDRVSSVLNQLIEPPTVVAIGSPNVGKSTLTNAMARSAVSIVSEQAGTTRDHVGVMLELPSPVGAVVVRWIDAPGFRSDELGAGSIEREAVEIAHAVLARANLVVLCGDAAHGFCDLATLALSSAAPILRVGTRSDLGAAAGADLQTAALTGEGVLALSARIRQRLIPDEALAWRGPWRFSRKLPTD